MLILLVLLGGFFFFGRFVLEVFLALISIISGLGSVIFVLFFDEFLFEGTIVLFLILIVVLAILVVVALELFARRELFRDVFLDK